MACNLMVLPLRAFFIFFLIYFAVRWVARWVPCFVRDRDLSIFCKTLLELHREHVPSSLISQMKWLPSLKATRRTPLVPPCLIILVLPLRSVINSCHPPPHPSCISHAHSSSHSVNSLPVCPYLTTFSVETGLFFLLSSLPPVFISFSSPMT